MSYLILSKERSYGIAYWWRPDSRGYTNDVSVAGRYSKDDALAICRDSHGKDIPIPEEEIGISFHARLIVDMGDHGHGAALEKFERLALGENV